MEKKVKPSSPEYEEINLLADMLARLANSHMYLGGEMDMSEYDLVKAREKVEQRMEVLLRPFVHISLRKYD